MISRRYLIGALPLLIAACAEKVWAPDELIAANTYVHDGPARISLITMKSVDSNDGAHSALIINASQRVIWDPAGTFSNAAVAERNDVIFGATARLVAYYISYHSRITYYTTTLDLDVPPEVAEAALRAVMAYGAVPKAHCSKSTSNILRTLPGFESLRSTYYPTTLEEDFAALPGVVRTDYFEDDDDDKSVAAAQIDAAIRAEN